MSVPFKRYPLSELVRQALAWRLLDVTESNGTPVDLVIPTKFPSYLVRHPRKVAWLFHQHREAYDLFGTRVLLASPTAPEDRRVREAIRAMDDAALGECRALLHDLAERGRRGSRASTGSPAEAALPAAARTLGRYRSDGYGDYLFYAGRLERLKRVDLARRRARPLPRRARLKIAGTGPAARRTCASRSRALGVDDRVDFLGFVSDDDLVDLYAALPRGAVRAAQRGLRLRDGRGLPLRASRC